MADSFEVSRGAGSDSARCLRRRNLLTSLGCLTLVVAVTLAATGCGRRSASQRSAASSKRKMAQEEERTRKQIHEMVARHNAVTDWHASLPQGDFTRTYSVLIDRAWVREDGRPVLVIASLHDISRHHGSYRVHLGVSLGPLAERSIDLSLSAGEGQVDSLLKAPADSVAAEMQLFAVVTRISSVGSTRDHIDTESEEDGEHIRAEVSSSTRAEGVLLEMIRIPGLYPLGDFPL